MKALPEQFKVTNEKAINSFSAQIIHEVNKDFKTLQLNLLKTIREAVKQEVSSEEIKNISIYNFPIISRSTKDLSLKWRI